VVDFVVGRVLSHNGGTGAASGLDDVTTYYLLHRHDFGLEDTPIGPCILYAVSCGLSDGALADQYDILVRTGGQAATEEDSEAGVEDADAQEEGTGSRVRLKAWHQRNRPNLGGDPVLDSPRARTMPLFPEPELPAHRSRAVPLIDQVHRLMHLWKAGDLVKVNDYLDVRGLGRSELSHHLLQALIELSPAGSEERSLLESISNHVAGRGVSPEKPRGFFDDDRP
jgi:putative DNA methylase